jgi:hypothetical protein
VDQDTSDASDDVQHKHSQMLPVSLLSHLSASATFWGSRGRVGLRHEVCAPCAKAGTGYEGVSTTVRTHRR